MKKTVIVTGANTGIGRATGMGLAGQNCHVILACRNKDKGETARTEIIEKTGNKEIDLLLLDLSSQKSIHEFTHNIIAAYPRLDVLINNAGVSMQTLKHGAGN